MILNSCSNILGAGVVEVLNYVYTAIRVSVPILVLVLVSKDFVQAVASQKDDDMKKAQATAIKRLIVGVLIFLVPTIIKVILWLIGNGVSTCTFG